RRVRQLQEKLKAGSSWEPPQVAKPYSGNLVTTETGGWLRRITIYKYELARLRERPGLHDVGPNTLRHMHAANMIHMGANVLEIQQRLGHRAVTFTLKKYGHFFPDGHEGAARLMDQFAASLRRQPREPGCAAPPAKEKAHRKLASDGPFA